MRALFGVNDGARVVDERLPDRDLVPVLRAHVQALEVVEAGLHEVA